MPGPLPIVLHHTAFVVDDVEQTARSLSASLGIGPWEVRTVEPTQSTVHGKAEPFSFRVAVADVGGGAYELVSPLSGRSVYLEQLEQTGPGFHHTALVYASLSDVRAAQQMLLREGREMLQQASRGEAFDFAYFAFPEIDSAIEVLFLDPKQLPPPDIIS